jgi:hypothetical protein
MLVEGLSLSGVLQRHSTARTDASVGIVVLDLVVDEDRIE